MTVRYLDIELNKISDKIGLIAEQSIKPLFYELCLSSEESFKRTKELLINKPFLLLCSYLTDCDKTIIKDINIFDARTTSIISDLTLLNDEDFTNTDSLSIILTFEYTDLLIVNPSKEESTFDCYFENMFELNQISLFTIFQQAFFKTLK